MKQKKTLRPKLSSRKVAAVALGRAFKKDPSPGHQQLVHESTFGFMAVDHKRGHLAIPKFYHPWDAKAKDVSPTPLASLKSAAGIAASAVPLIESEKHSDLAIMALGHAARAFATELERRAASGNTTAAKELWDVATQSTTALGQASGKFQDHLVAIARQASRMPAMVGTLAEDKDAVLEQITVLHLAENTTVRRHPRSPGKSGKSPSISGTPITALAAALIEYIDSIRTLEIVHGDMDRQLEQAGLDKELFQELQKLPQLRKTPGAIGSWCRCARWVIESHYESVLDIAEVAYLGKTRIEAGRPEGAEDVVLHALRQAFETLAK